MNQTQTLPQPPAIFFDKDYIHNLAREETIIYKHAVVNELNSLTNDDNKKKLVLDIIKRFGRVSKHFIKINGECTNRHYFIFNIDYCVGEQMVFRGWNTFNTWFSYNGIEILGTKPSIKTADGKFKYEGISIKQLKQACKDNGIKKYSKFSKLELVKALMKL